MGQDLEKAIVELVRSQQSEGIDLKSITEILGIWQSEASGVVNRLVKEGLLERKGKSPIRYIPARQSVENEWEKEPFSGIIGSTGSLSMQIQMAKAAVCYPPNGLHMLILGATGVGKTMLAREIWRYAVKERGEKIPYVTMNCAEYADNPQLLLSQLFGHEKGAFTGAEEEKEGLIDQADGGVLFLDEIHRLSPTGQEILFSVIDHGEFRRLGGVRVHKVKLMILGATTENPESSLLATFKRRIPVVLQLPLLRERPVRERFALVSLFFSQEATRMGIPIRVSKNILEYFVLFESDCNIGDLKNEVLLSCAYGYLALKSREPEKKPKEIRIDSSTGSRRGHASQVKPELRRMFVSALPEDGLLFQPGKGFPTLPDHSTHPWKPDFYESFSELTQDMTSLKETKGDWFDYIAPDVYAAANDLLLAASEEFQEFYAKNVGNSLAFFLQQIKSYARVGRGLMEQADRVMEQKYSREREFLMKHLEQLQSLLDTELTEGEITSIAFLLGQHVKEEEGKTGIIVAAYGEQIASGQVALTMQVLPETPIIALDFPLDSDFEEFKLSILSALHRVDSGRGVILCTDINLLFSKEAELSALSGTDCRIIPAVNSALLMELSKCASMMDMNAGELAVHICTEYRDYIDILFGPVMSMPENRIPIPEKRSVIITYCVTGTGSAKIARSLLLEHPEISQVADIIPLGIMSDLTSVTRRFGSRLRLVVGFLDPHLPNVPFIGLDSVFTSEGLKRILFYLQNWEDESEDDEPAEFLSLEERLEIVDRNIKNIAPSLNSVSVTQQARRVLEKILDRYPEKPEADFAVRVYIHVIAMFERLAVMENLEPSLKMKKETALRKEFFEWLYRVLDQACTALGLLINEAEVYYLMIVLP